MKILVKTLAGLEGILANELTALGAQNIEPLKRAVQFEGDLRLLYRTNYELRTAIRILVPIRTFQVNDENSLYRKVRQIKWSDYMDVDDTLAIDGVTNSPFFTHSKYIALKTKDAIVDQFRFVTGRRPNVDLDSPKLRINVHISHDQCTISLDSSGDPLFKRAYRADTVEAPINEVLSAGMILLSGWQKDCHFIDPMCGSGTNLIEAALYAYNIPPQLQRRYFGFTKWKDFDRKLWAEVKEQANDRITTFDHGIFGFDMDFKAIKITQQNIFGANLAGKIQVERKKFEKLTPPEGKGLLIMNPPYDERMATADINELYTMIGDRLKAAFCGYEAWIISANAEALKHIGLRSSKKIRLFNGQLECRFQKFELYEGSKKKKKNE